MHITYGILFVLVNTVDTTNMYFEECLAKYSSCFIFSSVGYGGMRRCRVFDTVQFFCTSSSPIAVVIGTNQPGATSIETLSIQSTATSKREHNSYCIEISADVSLNYFLQCRTNSSIQMDSKWSGFNAGSYRPENHLVQPIRYIDVKEMDSKEFCNSTGPDIFQKVPELIPCDSWHNCSVVLANHYKLRSYVNVTLVTLSKVLNTVDTSCQSVRFGILHGNRRPNFSKPGLLALYQDDNVFLIPYYPPINLNGKLQMYKRTSLAYQKKFPEELEIITIKCQSSVLHNCGFDIVIENVYTEKSHGGCHLHTITVTPIPDLKATITCRAFNEFNGFWDEKIISFGNNVEMSSESKTSEISNHKINLSNEHSTTYSPRLDDDRELPGSALVLIIVGTLLGGVFLCFLVLLPLLIYLYKRNKFQRRRIRLTEEECWEFMDGMKMEKAESRGIHDIFVLPYDRSLEVSKAAVDFQTTILGSGAFGQVVRGKYEGQDVAIKKIDSSTTNVESFRSLLRELKIMSYLGTHEHVMELVGAITCKIKQGEVYLILEYCAHGGAVNYVQGHRDAFVSFLSDDKTAFTQTSRDESASKLSSQHLVRWSYEVACGMEYVSSLKIYHGDLAARNILLTENLTVKIGDFGLSRQLDMENYTCYVQKGDCPLPLKWMAIESIRDLKFSIQSDVWSFGVTIWEFFSLGKIPYPGKKWNWESWKFLCDGERLERPEFASLPIYENIMRKCWEEDPKDRPAFAALKSLLQVEMEAFN